MAGDSLELRLERTKPSTLWADEDSIGHRGHLCAAHAWTDATQTNWNGILGDMTLSVLPSTRITSIRVCPDDEVLKAADVQAPPARGTALLRLKVQSPVKQEIYMLMEGQGMVSRRVLLALDAGINDVCQDIVFDGEPKLWSEFHPHLYELNVTLEGTGFSTRAAFGLRAFGTSDRCFTINGFKTFLRGTHDGCVFPLTGYCPTDTASWMRVFRIARSYGLNHFRFHSYTPTEAAFEAADRLGFYLQVELPVWGTLTQETGELNEFLLREADGILEQFGNHPSFMALL